MLFWDLHHTIKGLQLFSPSSTVNDRLLVGLLVLPGGITWSSVNNKFSSKFKHLLEGGAGVPSKPAPIDSMDKINAFFSSISLDLALKMDCCSFPHAFRFFLISFVVALFNASWSHFKNSPWNKVASECNDKIDPKSMASEVGVLKNPAKKSWWCCSIGTDERVELSWDTHCHPPDECIMWLKESDFELPH